MPARMAGPVRRRQGNRLLRRERMLHGIPQAVLDQAGQLGIPARLWMMSDRSDDFRECELVQSPGLAILGEAARRALQTPQW